MQNLDIVKGRRLTATISRCIHHTYTFKANDVN